MRDDYSDVSHVRLRESLGAPLPEWLEVYESFSPIEVESGERRSRMPRPEEDPRQGAVLLPLVTDPSGARLVYTVRHSNLNDHAGQISFPGGRAETFDDSLAATALREASEEIDLPPESVEIVCEMEDMYIPPSHYLVRPFVGLVAPGATLKISPDEVEEVFSVTLSTLCDPQSLRTEVWEREGRHYRVRFFEVNDETAGAISGAKYKIWGATAAITAAFLVRLGWSGYRSSEDA